MPHDQDLADLAPANKEILPNSVPSQWIANPDELWGMVAYARHFVQRAPHFGLLVGLVVFFFLPWLMFSWARLGIALLAIFVLIWTFRNRRTAPLNDLAFVPLDIRQHPVKINFAYRGFYYGSDSGILAFCDGWLHFQGRLSSFSIRRSDLLRFDLGQTTFPRYTLFGGEGWLKYKIQIQPITAGKDLEGKVRKRFAYVLDEEFTQWESAGPGQAVLPPQTPHPMARARLQWGALLLAIYAIPMGYEHFRIPTGNTDHMALGWARILVSLSQIGCVCAALVYAHLNLRRMAEEK